MLMLPSCGARYPCCHWQAPGHARGSNEHECNAAVSTACGPLRCCSRLDAQGRSVLELAAKHAHWQLAQLLLDDERTRVPANLLQVAIAGVSGHVGLMSRLRRLGARRWKLASSALRVGSMTSTTLWGSPAVRRRRRIRSHPGGLWKSVLSGAPNCWSCCWPTRASTLLQWTVRVETSSFTGQRARRWPTVRTLTL